MTLSTDGSAVWNSSSSMVVELDISRLDSDPTGSDATFFAQAEFIYSFSVPDDTTITIDYDVLATSTSTSGSGSIRWWGNGDYDIAIDNAQFHELKIGFTQLPSPIIYQDSVVFNILAGNHTVSIRHAHNGSGNQPGDRIAEGLFDITIGQIPEPSTLALAALGVLGAAGCQRKRDWSAL